VSRRQLEALEENCEEFGITVFREVTRIRESSTSSVRNSA